MRFLLDQNVYLKTALFLKNLGHDVIRVAEIGLESALDEKLLEKARGLDGSSLRGTRTSGTWSS